MKTVLIYHGYPEAESSQNSALYRYFVQQGYRILQPDLFSPNYLSTLDEILAQTRKLLGKQHPDVIIGISMGGLLTPHVARFFPDAKIILVGTGIRLKTVFPFYNLLLSLESKDPLLLLVRLARRIPRPIFRWLYSRAHHIRKPANADSNFDAFTSIPLTKTGEVLRLVMSLNNASVWTLIRNPTIIFSGTKDIMMPASGARQIQSCVPGSVLVESQRRHFEIFADSDRIHLEKFLN